MMEIKFTDFFERIKRLTHIKRQVQLAEELGVGRAAISIAKQKESVPLKWIVEICEKYNLNPLYLITGKGNPYLDNIEDSNTIFVKSIEDSDPNKDRSISIDVSLDKTFFFDFHEEYLWFKMSDNSMEPNIIPGDFLIVEEEKDLCVGDIFVLKWIKQGGDVFFVRRISIGEKGLILVADNVTYPPLCWDVDRFETVGRVVGYYRKFKK